MKDRAKLYYNAIYGKPCENQKKRTDIRLVNNAPKCTKLIEKPHMRGLRIFSDQLAAVDLGKIKAQIDKAFYVGFTVLEPCKLHLYKFHYHHIRAKFGDKAKLLFTDTDSLMYSFQEIDPFELFLKDHAEDFDFASYTQSHKFYEPLNNNVIGKCKDEANGVQVIDFVGLCPKIYSYLLK